MGLFWKIILFIAAIIVGTGMAKYREKLVRTFGKNEYFEKYLGTGGSYNFWPILGVVIIIAALVYLAS